MDSSLLLKIDVSKLKPLGQWIDDPQL